MDLRAARAQPGCRAAEGTRELSGGRKGLQRAAAGHLASAKHVKSPRQDFSTFLTPVRVPQCRRRVQESGTVNLAAAELVIDSSASSCCGTPFAATPGSAFGGLNLYPPVLM